MPRLGVLQNIQLAEDDADARRRKHFVAGKNIEVAVEALHVGLHVRYGLRSVEQHLGAVAMRHLDHFPGWRYCAEGVRNLRECHQPRSLPQKLLVFVQNHLPGIIHRRDAQPRALFGTQHLPGNDVGVVLQPGYDNLIVFLNILAAPALRH